MNSWIWFMFVLIGIWGIAVQIGRTEDELDLNDLNAAIAARDEIDRPMDSEDHDNKHILDLIRTVDATRKAKTLRLSKRPIWWTCSICGNSRTNTRKR